MVYVPWFGSVIYKRTCRRCVATSLTDAQSRWCLVIRSTATGIPGFFHRLILYVCVMALTKERVNESLARGCSIHSSWEVAQNVSEGCPEAVAWTSQGLLVTYSPPPPMGRRLTRLKITGCPKDPQAIFMDRIIR